MKTNRHITLIATALLLTGLPTSCVKDKLFDTTHPDHGTISVTPDWSARGEGIDMPATWNLNIGNYSASESGATHSPERLFDPGSYTLTVWNPAQGLSATGTTVRAESVAEGVITGNPDWFFTSVQEVAVDKDREYEFTVPMKQQIRQLTIIITPQGGPSERIGRIEAVLTGAAGSLDFAAERYGSASSVTLDFAKITDGVNRGKWAATVRLLGVVTTEQKLSGTIHFNDANPQPAAFESDLSPQLTDFNRDKTQPMTLSGNLLDMPEESGFTAVIEEWEEVKGEIVDLM